jgi:hypothetical protein
MKTQQGSDSNCGSNTDYQSGRSKGATLADLIGTTRSRVSFFMNRFRKLGYISYKGRIRVHKSLLNVVLHDQLQEQNVSPPILLEPQPSRTRAAKRIAEGHRIVGSAENVAGNRHGFSGPPWRQDERGRITLESRVG